MQESIRHESGGLTFRLFPNQKSAIGFANQLTKLFDAQFNAMPLKGTGGFLVASASKKEVHDVAGKLPESATTLLTDKGSYFEWSLARNIFNFDEVPLQDKCRWFVRRGSEVNLNRGFRSKNEASAWINNFAYRLDWRAGFVFRLRGDNVDMAIVDRRGTLATS